MPRPKGKSNSSMNSGPKAEGVAPYFRGIFLQHKKLLKTRSNKVVLQMWLADHPDYKEVPGNVKTGLANVKSNMRSNMHKYRGKKAAAEEAAASAAGTALGSTKTSKLLSLNAADNVMEQLEMLIDECLTLARNLDRKGKLENVIRALRIARNRVVWKLGEE
jgi:hypothetical protein